MDMDQKVIQQLYKKIVLNQAVWIDGLTMAELRQFHPRDFFPVTRYQELDFLQRRPEQWTPNTLENDRVRIRNQPWDLIYCDQKGRQEEWVICEVYEDFREDDLCSVIELMEVDD